jgi:hypothetical protein
LILILAGIAASCAATGPTKPAETDRSAVEFAKRVHNDHAFALERGKSDMVEHPDRVEYAGAFGIGGATVGKARKSDQERLDMIRESFDAFCQAIGARIVGKVCRSHDGFKTLFLLEVDRINPPPGKEKLGLTWVSLRVIEPRPGSAPGRDHVEHVLESETRAAADAQWRRRQAVEQRLMEATKVYDAAGIGSRICSEGGDGRGMSIMLIGFVEGKNDGRFQIRIAGTSHAAVREFYLQNDLGIHLARVNDIIWDDARRWRRC